MAGVLSILNAMPASFEQHHERNAPFRREGDRTICLLRADDPGTATQNRKIMRCHHRMLPIQPTGTNDHAIGRRDQIGVEFGLAHRFDEIADLPVTVGIAQCGDPFARRQAPSSMLFGNCLGPPFIHDGR